MPGIFDYFFGGGDDRADGHSRAENGPGGRGVIGWFGATAKRSGTREQRAARQRSFWASSDPKDDKKKKEYRKATRDRQKGGSWWD